MTIAAISLAAVAASPAVMVEYNDTQNSPLGVVLDFTTGTGVGTANAEFTVDDPTSASPAWIPLTNLTAKTATAYDTVNMPMRAIRLNVTAYTSGTITMKLLQGVS